MLLDLSKLHGSREHFERTFQPSEFDPQDDEYRVATPVAVSMDVEKAGPGVFRVQGRATDEIDAGVRPMPGRFGIAGGRAVRASLCSPG